MKYVLNEVRKSSRKVYSQKRFIYFILVLFMSFSPIAHAEEKTIVIDKTDIQTTRSQNETISTGKTEIVQPVDFLDKEQKIKALEKEQNNVVLADTSSSGQSASLQQTQLQEMSVANNADPANPLAYVKNGDKNQLHLTSGIDQSTGALTYTYQIETPPGRHAMTPELSLGYNSNQARTTSILGNGWNLSIPHISKINKYGSDKFYDTSYEVFSSSLDGELILIDEANHIYQPKKESGSFRKYQYSNNTWSFVDKTGVTYRFGQTINARQDNPTNTEQIFKWMLSSAEDTHTNIIRYTYFKEDGEIYPQTISYTDFGTTAGIFTINFQIENRLIPINSYKTGFSVVTRKKISEIQILVNNQEIKKYKLLYTNSNNGQDSLLQSIQESGIDEISQVEIVKPKTSFEYANTSNVNTWEFSPTYQAPTYNNASIAMGTLASEICFSSVTYRETCRTLTNPMNPPDINNMVKTKSRIIDVNGDGLQDLIFAPGYYSPSMPDFGIELWGWGPALSNVDLKGKVWLNTGTSWEYAPSFYIPTINNDNSSFEVCLFEDTNLCHNHSSKAGYMLDINGDGLQDIVYAPGSYQTNGTTSSNLETKGKVWLNTGTTWEYAPSFEIPRFVSFGISSAFPIYTSTDGSTTEYLITPNIGTSICNTEMSVPGSGYIAPLPICAFFSDINGDGLQDIVYAPGAYGPLNMSWLNPKFWDNPVVKGKIYLNTGTTWEYTPSFQIPTHTGGVIEGWNWNLGTPYPIELCISHRRQMCEPHRLTADFFDVNNDGLLDIVYADNDYYQSRVMLNNGTNWVYESGKFTIPTIPNTTNKINLTQTFHPSTGQSSIPFNADLVDLNNDGLLDISWGGTLSYLNTGSQWVLSSPYTPSLMVGNIGLCVSYQNPCSYLGGPMNNYGSGTGTNLAQYIDINNDGFQDIVYANGQHKVHYDGVEHASNFAGKVFYGNGAGWVENNQYIMPNYLNTNLNSLIGNNPSQLTVHELCFTSHICPPDDNNTSQFTDINGDDMPDIIYGPGYYRSTQTYVGNNQEKAKIFLHTGQKFTNYLNKITNSFGGVTNITYKNTLLKNGGGQKYTVVDTIIQTDPETTVSLKSQYDYYNGKLFYKNVSEKEFAGFEKVEEKLFNNINNTLLKKTVTYFHQGDNETFYTNTTSPLADLGESIDTQSKIGKPFRVDIYDAQNTVHQSSITEWQDTPSSPHSVFVYVKKQVSRLFNGNQIAKDTATEYLYDTYGNLTEDISYGEVTAQNNGTFMDVGNDMYKTVYSYATNQINQIFAPSKVTLLNQSNIIEKESKYLYDNQPIGLVLSGNVTTEQVWISDNTYANTSYIYNVYGNKIQTTDPNNNTIVYDYDVFNLYPSTVTAPLNMVNAYTYDYSSGKTRTTTDPNNNVYTQNYDGFDRLIAEYAPHPTSTGLSVLKTTIEYTDEINETSAKTTNYLTTTNGVDTYTYFNGFNKPIQISKEAQSGYTTSHTIYTALGQVYKQSLPYITSSFDKIEPPTDNSLFTTYEYDVLGRILSEFNSLGTTTHTYTLFSDTVTDANGNQKTYTKDTYGNLVSVVEYNNGVSYATLYEYNGLKNVIRVTDSLNNVRNFTYDGRGLQRSASDLHAPSDTTFGTYTYIYDLNGNMVQKNTPNGTTIMYEYNALNQQISENNTSTLGVDINYVYNLCANGKGKLCSATRQNVVTTYTYTHAGQIKTESVAVDTLNIFATSYTYDNLGNVVTILYPDQTQVIYGYGNAGLVVNVSYKLPAYKPVYPLITNIIYAPHNMIQTIVRANGVNTNYTYDTNHLYRLNQVISQKNTEPRIQDISYTYDAVGNILTLIDATNSATQKQIIYQYDDLYRLINTQAGYNTKYSYNETYTYNPIGNILSKGDVSYQYNQSQITNPHAPTTIGTNVLSYDPNGNVLTFGLQNNVWTYRNEISQITKNLKLYQYIYDHASQRVKEINDGVIKYTPNKYYTKSGTQLNKSIYLGDTLVGTMENTTVIYPHVNHLGSIEKVTNTTGAIVETTDYYPFGKEVLHSGTNSQRRFIGERYDNTTGLNYLNARYYDGERGQFLSQDPMFWKLPSELLSDPQQLNSYSYARNNPILMKDPTGEFSIKSIVQNINNYITNLLTSKPIVWNNSQNQIQANISKTENIRTTTWDSVSNARIKQLDPRVQQPATNFINNTESELNTRLRITQGYRSVEEQDRLYNQSRSNPPTGPWATNAKGGQSYHNYGLAIDVVVMEKGKPNWNKPITQDIANVAAKQGFEWGGAWAPPSTDYPHFQMTLGQSWQSLLKARKQDN